MSGGGSGWIRASRAHYQMGWDVPGAQPFSFYDWPLITLALKATCFFPLVGTGSAAGAQCQIDSFNGGRIVYDIQRGRCYKLFATGTWRVPQNEKSHQKCSERGWAAITAEATGLWERSDKAGELVLCGGSP